MAYRDAVAHIEQMQPDKAEFIGRECLNAAGILKSVLPCLTGVPARMQWDSDARDAVDRRLAELVALAEALYHAFDKAGPAILDYTDAQLQAQALVRQGIAAEEGLQALIAPIVATQSRAVKASDALRQWHDLREVTGALDLLAELGVREAVDQVRARAQALWYQATEAYDRAIRLEHEARQAAEHQLGAAYRLLPEFPGDRAEVGLFEQLAPPSDGHKYHLGPPIAPPLPLDSTFPYDASALPTKLDEVAYRHAEFLAGLAEPFVQDAAQAFAHYLRGTGSDVRIDYEKAYAEDAGVRRVVDAEIRCAQREAERLYAETGQAAFQMAGRAVWGKELAGGEYPTVTQNWDKTIGSHLVYGTSDVVVQGDQITMKITVHAADIYNFNENGNDRATGLPNEIFGRFSTLGWAKEFRTYGELERTVTWTIGEVPRG